jgi:transcriptional antiterminator RfaH
MLDTQSVTNGIESQSSEAEVRWHVVQSKPKAEREACEQLRRQGYVVALPELIRPRKRWEALFPRYMFLQPGMPDQSIAPVRSTLGVSQLVRFGNQPATVCNDVVVSSMAMAHSISGQDEVVAHGLVAGTAVQVTDGPLKGLMAMVKASAQDRVLILLEIMGRELQVHTQARLLRVA